MCFLVSQRSVRRHRHRELIEFLLQGNIRSVGTSDAVRVDIPVAFVIRGKENSRSVGRPYREVPAWGVFRGQPRTAATLQINDPQISVIDLSDFAAIGRKGEPHIWLLLR